MHRDRAIRADGLWKKLFPNGEPKASDEKFPKLTEFITHWMHDKWGTLPDWVNGELFFKTQCNGIFEDVIDSLIESLYYYGFNLNETMYDDPPGFHAEEYLYALVGGNASCQDDYVGHVDVDSKIVLEFFDIIIDLYLTPILNKVFPNPLSEIITKLYLNYCNEGDSADLGEDEEETDEDGLTTQIVMNYDNYSHEDEP